MTLEGKQFSRYRILQLIGQGGMGEVYLAEDIQVRRQVAAKFIRIEAVQADQGATATMLRQFWHEATTIAALDHPNILALYDHGETTLDGFLVAYLIIPYRREGSLTTWLRQRAQNAESRLLTLKQVAHVIQQAATALQYAHDHQVMHLDVKPANFLIRCHSPADEYPDLVLSDFGIARLVNTTSSMSQHMRGTPAYMAPEQWDNQPVFASDQYALAIMAYELLTGRPPFQGPPFSVMYAHAHEQPKPARDFNPLLSSDVDLVLQRALAKDPEARFPSVVMFAQAFQAAIQGLGVPTRQVFLEDSEASVTWHKARLDSQATSPQLSESETLSYTTSTVQDLVPLAPHTSTPPAARVRGSSTFPPAPLVSPAKRRRSSFLVIAQILLSLLLITGIAIGIYRVTTGEWPGQDTPGKVWHSYYITPSVFLNNVVWSKNQFVAVGNNDTIAISSNGSNWNIQHPPGTTVNLRSIAWSGSEYVVIGEYNTILTSPDGRNWSIQLRRRSTQNFIVYVIWSGSEFVVVGDKGLILTSPDGKSWTSRRTGIQDELWGGSWSEQLQRFVVVGSNGSVLASADGITWTRWTSGTQKPISGVAWSGTRFVAVGFDGTILTSLDGRAWMLETSNNVPVLKLYRVMWAGTQFVIVGENGTILTSPDGITWTRQVTGTSELLSGIASSGQQYVIVGDGGIILASP